MELVQKLLLEAIEGESGAEAKYKECSLKALDEGFKGVAALFSALARAEAIHIANHTRALIKNGYSEELPDLNIDYDVLSTLENLDLAILAEEEEFKEMYPSFRQQIHKKFGNIFTAKIALLSIRWAHESEKGHHGLLSEARDHVAKGRDIHGGDYYLCSVCGNIHYSQGQPETLCEVCGHDLSFYTLIQVEK